MKLRALINADGNKPSHEKLLELRDICGARFPNRAPTRLYALSAYPVVSACPNSLGFDWRKIRGATDLIVGGGFAPGPEAQQRSERSHRQAPSVVAKNELIKINLKLLATHAVISPDQPLLQVPDCAVRKRHDRFRAFA